MSFLKIQKQVKDSILSMGVHLYEVNVDKDELYIAYLDALPPEERQGHNCNCCRSFINKYGHLVALDENNDYVTVWDFLAEGIFKDVPEALNNIVFRRQIVNVFYDTEKNIGTDHNLQLVEGKTVRWNHFVAELNSRSITAAVATKIGETEARRHVVTRSLNEISLEAVDTVLDLITNNTLYRGQEYKGMLESFRKHHVDFLHSGKDTLYVWKHFLHIVPIRNSAIGTLLTDITDGVDIEAAVGKYETIVAPANYARPKKIVTQAMITKAKETLASLGCLESIKRRHATADDIDINDALYIHRANSSVATVEDPFTVLSNNVAPTIKKALDITMGDFLTDVVPKSSLIEVLVEGRHESNMVSLLAPVEPSAPTLFKWASGLSWDYNGNLTDSVAQRVKQAGGDVDGELVISLDWFNTDDLDLHVVTPKEQRINYTDKSPSGTNGRLDVDMNCGSPLKTDAVENIIFKNRSETQEGQYLVKVHNYHKRDNDPKNQGFNLTVSCRDTVINVSRSQVIEQDIKVNCVSFNYSHKAGVTNVKTVLDKVSKNKSIWGVDTNRFHKLSMILDSPNYWGKDAIGNKHLFFIIEGVINDGSARGFYNEFLNASLQKDRKVFEVLGSSMKVAPSSNQLSGLGFSTTLDNSVTLRVDNVIYCVNTKQG